MLGLARTLAQLRPKGASKAQSRLEAHAQRVVDRMTERAPRGETGQLAVSIGWEPIEGGVRIFAGGEPTTRDYGRGAYRQEVKIGQGNNRGIARGNAGVSYDYALAAEFGTQHVEARPFFWNTVREMLPEILADVEGAAVMTDEPGEG